MNRASKSLELSGRKITVSESTWETASARTRIEEQARADRARLNGSGDPVFLGFVETYYGFLSSCSSGEVPTAEEALSLSDEDLDRWYLALIDVNPESFLKVNRLERGEVSFRDGSRFEIVSSYLPSVTMRRIRLEEEALRKEEDREKPKDIFGVYLYPILAACSRGEVPPPDVIRETWPETEIYKWRDAVEEVNPQWFGDPGQSTEATLEQSKDIKKKDKRRPRQSRVS